jgi:hypothetical protein
VVSAAQNALHCRMQQRTKQRFKMLWVLTLLLAVVGGQGGVCDNVKCANKNGRCCANVGGRRRLCRLKRAFAWTTTLWAETFANVRCAKKNGRCCKAVNGRGVCMDCTEQNRRNPLSNNNRRGNFYPTKRTPFVEGGLGVSFRRVLTNVRYDQ